MIGTASWTVIKLPATMPTNKEIRVDEDCRTMHITMPIMDAEMGFCRF